MNEAAYEVCFILVVDRPELRGASFRPVAPGTRSVQRWYYASQADAVAVFEQMISGAWDYSSEYVAAAGVTQRRPGRGLRTVRRRVERVRSETSKEKMMAMLGVGAARRRATLGADGWFHIRNIVDVPAFPARAAETPDATTSHENEDVELAVAA